MAGSVNRAFIIGHLGRDPETKTLPGGSKVTTFSIATSDNWARPRRGDQMNRRDFTTLIGGAVVALPFTAHAQQKTRPVIGWLSMLTPELAARTFPTLL